MKLKTTLARLALTTAAVAFGATMALADGTVVAVVGGKADDAFFAKVKKGIDDATLVVTKHDIAAATHRASRDVSRRQQLRERQGVRPLNFHLPLHRVIRQDDAIDHAPVFRQRVAKMNR